MYINKSQEQLFSGMMSTELVQRSLGSVSRFAAVFLSSLSGSDPSKMVKLMCSHSEVGRTCHITFRLSVQLSRFAELGLQAHCRVRT